MKARSILIVMVLILLAGCNSHKPEFYWFQPGKTIDEVKVDYDECEIKAQQEATKSVEDRYFEHLRSPIVLGEAGKLKGEKEKRKEPDDPVLQAQADWAQLYKQNAFSGCMQSRGYVKLRPYQVAPELKTKDLPMGAIAGKPPKK